MTRRLTLAVSAVLALPAAVRGQAAPPAASAAAEADIKATFRRYDAALRTVKRDGRWQQVVSQLTPIAGK